MMESISVSKATVHGIRTLSKKLELLEDKNSQIYQENVAKFGIPEEYVRKAFSEEAVLEATKSGKSTIYLALENRCKILGFAQTIQRDHLTTELDRIVVFPSHTRMGIGTRLLTKAVNDEKKKGTKTIIVNAGKKETHARRFYEKNEFKPTKETEMDAPWGSKIVLVTYQLQIEDKKHN
ncbi:GNAT family N-acetyltransferase [Candidatus Bathyarchaeota archaeon]|nr:GNAT family N-acetyltransferase [Candidatus Bathyarchaeota archaeon]